MRYAAFGVWLAMVAQTGLTLGHSMAQQEKGASLIPEGRKLNLPCCAMVEDIPMQIVRAAIEAALEPSRALRVAHYESRYQVNPPKSCCFGIFQLHPASFPGAARMTPQQNIAAGVRYLAENARRYGANAERVFRVGHP